MINPAILNKGETIMKNTMSHILRLSLALMLVITCFLLLPTDVQAATVASGTSGAAITWTLDDNGTLTITGSGKMANSDWGNSTPWYEYNQSITKVIVDDGITAIGDFAFIDCDNLTQVQLADSVTEIGELAFRRCRSLTSISIPHKVTEIAYSTFNECTALKSVDLPSSLVSIQRSAFENCTALETISISKMLHT